MRRLRKIAVVLTAVIIVAIGFYTLRPKQPSYGGKTLEQWLDSSNPIPSEAVHAMGTNCIPTLHETIQARPSAFSRWLHWCLPKLGWHRASIVKLSRMKSRATEAFVVLGTNGISAMKDLVKILENSPDNSREIAAFCLAGMGETGIARLVKAFGHKRAEARIAAAGACYYASLRPEMINPPGTLAKFATPHLLYCVTNDSVPAAVLSLRALSELNREIPWIIPSLIGTLNHPNVAANRMVLQYNLQAIGYFGQRAAGSSNAITPFLSHPDPMIAREATNALRSLQERP